MMKTNNAYFENLRQIKEKWEQEKAERKERRVCPECGKPLTGYPALSRKDNKTEICSDCGIREALADFGM